MSGEPKSGAAILEYRLQGPLYAASAIFARCRGSEIETFDVELNAKLPFGKSWQRSIRAEVEKKRLKKHTESDGRGGAQRSWVLQGGELVLSDSKCRIGFEVRSAAEILFLAHDLFSHGHRELFEVFVAGGGLSALDVKSGSSSGTLLGRFKKLEIGSTAPSRSNLDWSACREFELDWDEGAKRISALRIRWAPLGRLEARLVRDENL